MNVSKQSVKMSVQTKTVVNWLSKELLTISFETKQSSRQEGVIDDNFSYFSSKPYVVTPHLNRLVETVQMKGHNICF